MARPQLNTVTLDFFTAEFGGFIIDIPKWLSIVNRKSYRSGYVYSVDYIEYIGSANDMILVGKLPETYACKEAYKLGYDSWKRQRAQALEESGGTLRPGKWSDFKPYYDITHMDGTRPEMGARGLGAGVMTQQIFDETGSDWARPRVTVADQAAATTDVVAIGMLGNDDLVNGYASCFDALGDLRGATLAPDPMVSVQASESWVVRTGEAIGEHTLDVINLIEEDNDDPPYANQTNPALPSTYVGNGQSAPGGILVDTGVTGTTGRAISLNGGLIPLGLLAVEIVSGASPVSGRVRIHLTRGDYKGVAALKMGDFN